MPKKSSSSTLNASKRATLNDVAKDAGVSKAVVSYVLNNGPRNVSDATRTRVMASIAKLNYRRNTLASALTAGSSHIVGILVPDAANAFFAELAREFETEGRKRGYLTLLGNTSNDSTIEKNYLDALGDLRARGVFVTSVNDESYRGVECPKVYVHSAPMSAQSPRVLFDDFGGGRMATEHLIGLGYRNIHCLAGASDFGPLGRRRRGWETAMNAAGLETAGKAHFISANRLEAAAQIRVLLSSPERPEAIFATTDEQALAMLRAALELRLTMPTDVALVGFDGVSEAKTGSVRISTIDLPLQDLAVRAFDALEGERKAVEQEQLLSGSLWIGETCGQKKEIR